MGEPHAMTTPTLAFIGCGNMGGAILQGVLDTGARRPDDVLAIDHEQQHRDRFAALGVRTSNDAADAHGIETVLLAVKPQQFNVVAESLGPVRTSTLFISVMAGLTSDQLARQLDATNARIIRAMPNTPCQIQLGVSAIARGAGSTDADLETARELLLTVGSVVTVNEEQIDAVTATSGSGPAYLFLFAEAWIDAACERGLERKTAEELVIQTISGAAALLSRNRNLGELRKAVTSKAGTTAAGIDTLERLGLRAAMKEALRSAEERAFELASDNP